MHVSFRRSTLAAAALLLAAAGSVLGQERVDPIPDAPEQIVEALSPFRANPDSSHVANLLADTEASAGFPTMDIDHVLVARLWRRAGETDLAMASLQAAARGDGDGGVADLATYEMARVLLESGENDVGGADAYWRACSTTDDATRAELGWDHLSLMTPEERDEWAGLEPGVPICEWLRDFWDERAQGMAVPRDRRIAVHYQRQARARDEMWLSRPRFYREVTDEHGRPPGLSIDDRGLMLIRLGEPEAREMCPADADPLAECWAYHRPDGYQLFRFSQYKKARGDVVPNGDYSLDEGVPYRAAGDAWNHKYVLNADLPRTAQRALARLWRASYSTEDFLDETERTLDDAEFSVQGNRALVLATRHYTEAALLEIPDVPDIESTLTMRSEMLRFLNPTSRQWQIWLLASVRAGDLLPSLDAGPAATRNVGGRFSVLADEMGVSIGEIAPRSVPVASTPDDAGIGLRGVLTAPPGPLPLTVVIEDRNAPGTGAWHQDTINLPAIGGLPQLSDIAVAQAEGGSWTRDGQTFLQVSPAHITNPDGSIHTYFEVYGVRSGTRYEVELRLAEVDAADRIWRLEPGDLGFRLQFSSEMPGEIGRHHLRLDLSGTEPGQYVLGVRIQDEDTKAYSLPTVTDVFVATN